MNQYVVYMSSGNKSMIRADDCQHTSGNKIIFKNDDNLDNESGKYEPEQIVGIFNFNNIEGIECLGKIKE